MLIIILRATTKKITTKHIVKERVRQSKYLLNKIKGSEE